MTRGIIFISLVLAVTCLRAQDDQSSASSSSGDVAEIWSNSYYGILNGALPISLELKRTNSEVEAIAVYGESGKDIAMEGSFDPDGTVTLYEFDADARILGIITGNISSLSDWKWYSHDYSRWWPIELQEGENINSQVQFLELDSPVSDIISVRSHNSKLGFLSEQPYELRWVDYTCVESDCILVPMDEDIDNPIEFKLEEAKSLKLLIYPSEEYKESRVLKSTNLSGDRFSYFYAFHFPKVGQDEFDSRMIMEINEVLRQIKPVDETSTDASLRMKNGYFGDYFITLYSKELLSGFLYFYSNQSSEIETLPFIYDLKKEEFCELADLFKSGYDYPFFTRSYLENQKRKQGIGQNRLTREYLNNLSYSHYVLTDKGLLYISDFNMLFGRRSILIPFTEFSSFLDNKSVINFAKRVR